MKRWKKILLVVLLVLTVTLGGLCIWQWGNTQALYAAATKDPDTLLQDMEHSRQELEESLKDHDVEVSAPTLQQNEALLNGEVTADEVKEQLGLTQGNQNTQQDNQESSASQGSTSSPQPSQSQQPGNSQASTAQALVNACVAELYSCQIDLMSYLGQLKQDALAQWNSLSDDQRTSAKLREIGLAGLEKCYHLEVSADNQVKDILAHYRAELESIGADTSVLDTLWEYYCNEKASQKAYYINKYLG